MRLIDADALIKSLQVNQEVCFGCPESEWLDELISVLENAPTILPHDNVIDRADAIEAVRVCDVFLAYQGDKIANNIDGFVDSIVEQMRDNISRAVSALPSAEAVQGEWIHDGQNFKGGLDWCHCSECGYKTSTNGLSVYRFCPNCGAKMKGGAE